MLTLFHNHNAPKDVIKNIVLTALCNSNEKTDYENLSTDVVVEFEDGEKYIATFYSCSSLEAMIKEDKLTREFHSGEYYKVLNMIVVKDFNEGNIIPVVERMIAEGDFQVVFNKI
jgi:hypothetical protein